MLITGKSVNFDKNFEGKMEGYLEIFGRKFCGKKGNFGLWRRKLFFWEWKHWVTQWAMVTPVVTLTDHTPVWREIYHRYNQKYNGLALKSL